MYPHPFGLALRQRSGLVENRGWDAVKADVVHESGASDGSDVGVGQSSLGRGAGGEVGHRPGVAGTWRGSEVGEVGDRFQHRV